MNVLTNLSKKQNPQISSGSKLCVQVGEGGVGLTSHLLMQQTWLFEAFLL